jgi:hypothetical protein
VKPDMVDGEKSGLVEVRRGRGLFAERDGLMWMSSQQARGGSYIGMSCSRAAPRSMLDRAAIASWPSEHAPEERPLSVRERCARPRDDGRKVHSIPALLRRRKEAAGSAFHAMIGARHRSKATAVWCPKARRRGDEERRGARTEWQRRPALGAWRERRGVLRRLAGVKRVPLAALGASAISSAHERTACCRMHAPVRHEQRLRRCV